MHYTNSQMKLDQLIGYFNTRKINLIPSFQRGHVWSLPDRQRLLENMVRGRPIPAIFLYKEPAGSQFEYNILDGKQRLESLILFIGSARADLKLDNVKQYFFGAKERGQIDFSINLEGEKLTFKELPEETVREFREYAIPTIEIDMDDQSSLDEIISLFVDINQQGEKVTRFEIIKAIGKDNPLLSGVFDLVAMEQERQQDRIFKKKDNVYTRVLQRLQHVQSADDDNQMVDRMWERLVEVALFIRTGVHRLPNQILKAFIKPSEEVDTSELSPAEIAKIRKCFNFLDKCYAETDLGDSRLASELPHFYTMVTSLVVSDLLEADGAPPDYPKVRKKLRAFAKLVPDNANLSLELKSFKSAIEEYRTTARRQTTTTGQRKVRQERFLEILGVV